MAQCGVDAGAALLLVQVERVVKAAVKAAVMCEEVARTVHIARQLGEPLAIEQSDIDSLYARYQNVYGQPGST